MQDLVTPCDPVQSLPLQRLAGFVAYDDQLVAKTDTQATPKRAVGMSAIPKAL